jgi:inorganic pyrophosphatase
MTDYNRILNTGDVENGIVNAVIEVPLGGPDKIEWHRQTGQFDVENRPTDFNAPAGYGFIPQTLSGDGDELDILVLGEEPLKTGSTLKVRVAGVMEFEDEGSLDDKIITVPLENEAINDLGDIPKQTIDQITNHFAHYKDYKGPNATLVKSWRDAEYAKGIIIKARELFEKSRS